MRGLEKRDNNLMRWENIYLSGVFITLLLVALPLLSEPVLAGEKWTGRKIMDEVFNRHELFPYIFEEQSMILMDGSGNRDVREVRRFSRVEKDGTVKFLMVIDNPEEVRGVALLAILHPSGPVDSRIYLPAFGKELISNGGEGRGSLFLGTDFAIEDLTAEILSDFRYVRKNDKKIEKTAYFVVEAFPQDKKIEKTTGYSLRRHLIQKNNFFIVQTEYYDRRGRFFKRQTYHDLVNVDGDMWRANMILMENIKGRHKTLLKINRRVFSHDYVPPEIFTAAWILENRHIQDTEKRLLQKAFKPLGEKESGK